MKPESEKAEGEGAGRCARARACGTGEPSPTIEEVLSRPAARSVTTLPNSDEPGCISAEPAVSEQVHEYVST